MRSYFLLLLHCVLFLLLFSLPRQFSHQPWFEGLVPSKYIQINIRSSTMFHNGKLMVAAIGWGWEVIEMNNTVKTILVFTKKCPSPWLFHAQCKCSVLIWIITLWSFSIGYRVCIQINAAAIMNPNYILKSYENILFIWIMYGYH